MSVALIELIEMTATLNVVVSINSTTVMQTYWTASRNESHFLIIRGVAFFLLGRLICLVIIQKTLITMLWAVRSSCSR